MLLEALRIEIRASKEVIYMRDRFNKMLDIYFSLTITQKRKISKLRNKYDICVPDCYFIIVFTWEDIYKVTKNKRIIEQIRDSFNPTLEISGILLTMVDLRMNLTKEVIKEVRHYFPDKVYKTLIPRNVRLAEAPSFGKPAILYARRSKGSRGYLKLAKEVLKNAKKSIRKRS